MNNPKLYSFPSGNELQIISMFEEWIVFIANRYCRNNSIDPYEEEDLNQFIRMRLIEQLPKIKNNFKGGAKLRTYISAIILNLCREFRRTNCSKSVFTSSIIDSETVNQLPNINQGERNIALKKELEKLNQIIQLYGSKKIKLKIALSLYYRLNPDIENLEVYCNENKQITTTIREEIMKKGRLNKKEGLKIFTELLNQIENKSNSVEASRKWVTRTIDDILKLLNCNGSQHTKETLGILIEMNQIK